MNARYNANGQVDTEMGAETSRKPIRPCIPVRELRREQSSAAETPSLSFGDDLGECVVERLERCLEQGPGRLGKMKHFPDHEARFLRLANPFR